MIDRRSLLIGGTRLDCWDTGGEVFRPAQRPSLGQCRPPRYAPPAASAGQGGNHALTIKTDHSVGPVRIINSRS
jgi:hypothetical protein